ncbi:uncharacterized protein LOC116456754 [Hylobates moloch]|uniref:uncharacterized protein LOC116456754 n=1 Tax=Hylobates moloch TaxID=81572 RepID=UPI0026745FEF|nr:uncharacterized protein LOC116456754 [Hylobates moloch]
MLHGGPTRMQKQQMESGESSAASQPQACPYGVRVRLKKMPGDRTHPSSDSIESGAKASFNPPPNPQYKPKFWNKSFPTPPSEMLPGSRQCLLTSLQQEAQLVNCTCAAGGRWMQGINRWIPSIPPLHNHSAVNRRHFSTPEKLHADCEKEMLDGGVPGTTVRGELPQMSRNEAGARHLPPPLRLPCSSQLALDFLETATFLSPLPHSPVSTIIIVTMINITILTVTTTIIITITILTLTILTINTSIFTITITIIITTVAITILTIIIIVTLPIIIIIIITITITVIITITILTLTILTTIIIIIIAIILTVTITIIKTTFAIMILIITITITTITMFTFTILAVIITIIILNIAITSLSPPPLSPSPSSPS